MKSKTSFINKTMLQKNVKLYWPIWTLYTIVLLFNGPFSMWSRFKSAYFIYGTNWHKYMLDIMSPAISMEADMIFIFVMALVTGMAMFSYLYNSRACNMIHAMPVTRRQLFSTNVLTGLLFMWIPQIVKYIMSFVICISYGNTKVVHIGINLLATMGISFFMYSLVCLCAMITGQLVSVAVMYALVNLLYGGAVIAIANVLTYVSYGLSYMEFVRKISATWFAPMLQLLNRVGFHPTMKNAGDDYYCIKYTFRGTNTIVVYVIAAAVIYFISYKIYKHRDLENAGSFIAIPKLKPVFRWGLGSLGGLILSIVAASLLLGLRISIGVPAIMMLAVVLVTFCLVGCGEKPMTAVYFQADDNSWYFTDLDTGTIFSGTIPDKLTDENGKKLTEEDMMDGDVYLIYGDSIMLESFPGQYPGITKMVRKEQGNQEKADQYRQELSSMMRPVAVE